MLLSIGKYLMTDDKNEIRKHSQDIKNLLEQSYWAKDRTLSVIENSIERSLCYGVFNENRTQLLGFARVVTDYSTMYYLCDLIIDAQHRGNGLGKKMVEWIVNDEEKLQGLYGMLLTSDAQGLYSQYGFSENQRCMCKFQTIS